ncbi:MAG: MBL fold metallo-hydrolase [Chloroflexota bacterium]|nr:MAG: MBL fold metallo-hydrolase [Chloroflexota bacterium]
MEYVSTRRIGDAEVTIIREADGRWAPHLRLISGEELAADLWRQAMPEADGEGAVPLAFNAVYIRHGAASVLIDPCFGEPEPNDPWSELRIERTPGREAGLASIGVRPADITHVLLSHNHGDHLAGATIERGAQRLARFPNARYLINRREWEPARGGDDPLGMAALHLGALERLGVLDLVDDDREIMPGLTMIHAPGETAGHSVFRLDSRGETFIDLTDLYHFAVEAEHADWAPAGNDIAVAMASRQRIVGAALASNALVTYGHAAFPGWNRLAGTADRARFVAA